MRWLNRILVAAAMVAALAFLPQQLAEVRAPEDLARVESERATLAAGNAELRQEIALLEAEVRALHANREDLRAHESVAREVERIAREDLNLVRRGEVVFEIETSDAEKGAGK